MVTPSEKNLRMTALMQAANAGDGAAYRQFLTEISMDLRRFLGRRIAAKDVDDVLQEILLSVDKARHTYDGKRMVLPWVSAIARFRLTDYLRRHYAKAQHLTVDIAEMEENLADPVTDEGADYEYLSEAVAQLPDRQQKILHLMHHQGFTAKEVGVQLGMNESAVKVAAHRAYKLIRTRLGRE
jgi:RNA polymerase sigma-70 factor (ECF subfamily)